MMEDEAVGEIFGAGEDVATRQWLLNKFEDTEGLVLNVMHRSEGEGAGHSDSKSLVNLCAITLTNKDFFQAPITSIAEIEGHSIA